MYAEIHLIIYNLPQLLGRGLDDTAPPWYYDRALKIPIYRRYHLNRIKAVCSELPRNVGLLIDVGCDGGTLTYFMKVCSKAKVIAAVDIKVDSITYASKTKSKEGLHFLVSDGRYLPIPSGRADVITLLEVLEHVENPETMIAECRRVLKPHGQIIILIPNNRSVLFKCVWWLWTRTFGKVWVDAHNEKFDVEKLKKLLIKRGFHIKERKLNLNMLILIKATHDNVIKQ